MNIGEQLLQIVEQNSYPDPESIYDYDPGTETFLFKTGEAPAEYTLFDFKVGLVGYHGFEIPIAQALPFMVDQESDHSRVYVQIYNRRVCIFGTLLDAPTITEQLQPIEQEILLEAKGELTGSSSYLAPSVLRLDRDTIERGQERLEDSAYIRRVLDKESGDENRRMYTRYIPMGLGVTALIWFLGSILSFGSVYFEYFFNFIAFLYVVYFIFFILRPTLQGAGALYLGRVRRYPRRLGIILPLIDPDYIEHVPKPNQHLNNYRVGQIVLGKWDTRFILAYPPHTSTEIILKEYREAEKWLQNSEVSTYYDLRERMFHADFVGMLQLVISSITGYLPDDTGRPYFRSEIHPPRDVISIYPLHKLAPLRLVLGYGSDDLIFIPFYVSIWDDLNFTY